MQSAAAMNFDIKALLTLLLLKTGTSSKEIQTAVNLAAAARLMATEESAEPSRTDNVAQLDAARAAKLRPDPRNPSSNSPNMIEADQDLEPMNSDIKALLSLLLLQNGVSSNEIRTTLRLSAKSRLMMDDAEPSCADNASEPRASGIHSITPRQALRNEQLAPAPLREFAA
jgi:hypothetical protein